MESRQERQENDTGVSTFCAYRVIAVAIEVTIVVSLKELVYRVSVKARVTVLLPRAEALTTIRPRSVSIQTT